MAYYGKRSKKSRNSYNSTKSRRGGGSRKSYSRKNRRSSAGNSNRTIRIVVEQAPANPTRTPDSAYITQAPVQKKATF